MSKPTSPLTGKRVPDAVVRAMWTDYQSGMSCEAVAQKHGRSRAGVSALLRRRGHRLRPVGQPEKDRMTGQFRPFTPLTPGEIDAILASATRLVIPPALRPQWRHWDMTERAAFLARLKAKVKRKHPRPDTPFSANVTPFDYCTPAAWEILNRLNEGRDSRTKRAQIRLCSEGVIHEGVLYFWSDSTGGYEEGCPWTPERGRSALNRVLWERAHGKKVPPGHVVRHADGNRNNFEPGNLVLATRNELCRENQAATLARQSREKVSLLLNRTTAPTDENNHIHRLRARQQA